MKTKTKVIVIGIPLFLFLCAIPIAILSVVFGGIYYGTKNMEEYTCAVNLVKEHKEARELLGDNVEPGYFFLPNVHIEGSRRIFDLKTSVSGSKDSADLFITSYRDNFRNDYSVWIEQNSKQIPIHKGTFPCN